MIRNRLYKEGFGVPMAVIVAGVFIAIAILLTSGGGGNNISSVADSSHNGSSNVDFRMPNEEDHVRGNPDAKVSIIEFSDFECPFCAQLHPTLSRLVEENIDVKWVYRHFPLSSIHRRALSSAVASECVAKLGGNEAFWEFADDALKNQKSLSDDWYKNKADSFGIDSGEFQSCLNNKSIVSQVQDDLREVTSSGGRGTPFVVVVTASGELTSFSGALPYEQILSIVDQARNN